MSLDLRALKDKSISEKGNRPSKAIQYEPLKMVKTFTTTLTKDFKKTELSQGLSIPPPPPRVLIDLKKGSEVEITEFYNGRTIYVINGDKWYESQLKNKKELKEILEGKRERPKGFGGIIKYGLRNNATNEQIQAKIDAPITLSQGFFKPLTYDMNKNAFRIDKSYLALNSKKEAEVVNEVKFGDPLKNKMWILYVLLAVGGYFAYKKFIK